MTSRGRVTPFLRSIRAKLLVMLGVLSLPLLVLSLYQLNNYRRSLNDQAATITHIEANAAAGALKVWLDQHFSLFGTTAVLSDNEVRNLYLYLHDNASPEADDMIVVYDREGRVLRNPFIDGPTPETGRLASNAERLKWTDGVARMTKARRIDPWGWTVTVGVPVAENTSAGRAGIALAATWAFTLMASILLGFWAVGRFTKPLRKLASLASTLGEGHLQERVPVETEDEVGTLAQNFNFMAGQLETKFKELQTQGTFIEEVLNGLPLGVALLDASLIVCKINPTFARFVGRDAVTLSGRGLYEAAAGLAVLSDVVEDVRRSRKPFVAYGLPLNLVARNAASKEDAEGTSFWDVTIWPVMERGAGRGDLLLVLSEVSKRVRAEKLATAAFASERTRAAELESVINQMNEGVVIIDRHMRYKINPAAAEIIGRKRSDFRDYATGLITDMSLKAMEGRELAPEETPIMRALERREQVFGEQLKIARPDGQERVIAISVTPLTGEDGQQEGAVAVFRDITENVRQHDELVAAYDRLREHDRLKSAFVSNISHELRTPLNVIIGLCQLLIRDRQLPLAPLQDEAVVRMERNARSLLELVNDLLDYSRLEAGRAALHLENVRVGEVVASIVEDYAQETKDKRVALSTEVAPDLDTVLTDKYKLEQVLSNLIGNAVKFTSVGGIKITAGLLDGERWFLEVSDTGIGISSDALSYIFDEFRQVDDRLARSYGGTGLGLAITRKIVELLEGEISVTSEPQAGSRFRIVWPRKVRQRTGTGSLIEKSVPAPTIGRDLRSRAR
jgi:PAS domain S-box-containing protein